MYTYNYQFNVVPVSGTSLFTVYRVQLRTNIKARGSAREPVIIKRSTVKGMNRVTKDVAEHYVWQQENKSK